MNNRFNDETFIDEEVVEAYEIPWLLRLAVVVILCTVITTRVYVEDDSLTRLGNHILRSLTGAFVGVSVTIVLFYIEALFRSARPK